MTKPAPLASLGLPPATSFEPGRGSLRLFRLQVRCPPIPGASPCSGLVRFTAYATNPVSGDRASADGLLFPRTGCRRLRFRLVRTQQAVRWEAVRTGEPFRGIPVKEPSGSAYDGRRFCDADVCVVPFPILRQRRRGQSGDAAPPRLLLRSVCQPGTRTGTPATACAGRPLAALESSGPERFRFPAASSGARGNDHASKYC